MAKTKLTFKITGKNITYEGHPERRPKDLMDILAKLGVNNSVVLPAFRENIENEADYTDEAVMELFEEARTARAEKKARTPTSTTSATPSSSAAAAAATAPSESQEPEKTQKLTLIFKGKQFSYQGLPSGKKSAVLQLLLKQKDVSQDVAVETYRTNLPDDTAADDEIWKMVTDAKEAKRAKEQSRQSAHHDPAAPSSPTTTAATTATAAVAAGGAAAAVASAATDDSPPANPSAYDALDELTGMSVKERDDLNDFIRQVLEQPPTDVAALLREEPKMRSEADENTEIALTARTSGKLPVYCQEANSTGTKLIYATATMTYEELLSIVEKKFGRKMALSFYEDNDEIELDDDDVLAMYLEMTMQTDPKKVRLICSNPDTRKKRAEDKITEGRPQVTGGPSMVAGKVKSFSNGELAVREERTYAGHSLAVYCCSFSPKGDLFVTASRDRSVRVWNVRTGSCTVMKGGHNGFVLSCDFSPKGNRVVSSSDDRSIKLWNTSTFSKVATLKGHEDKVYCVKYNPSGDYIVSGSCDHTVRVWNAETQSKVVTLKGHTLAVFSCGFSYSDNGKYVVSGSDDRMIKIWDWQAGKEVKSLVGHIGTVWTVTFSHSDKFIVSGSMDYELMLWDVAAGSCLRSMSGHSTSIHHAIFSDDDKYIFSCARDWSVMIWHTDDGEHVETITGHASTVYHMDTKGDKLLTSSLDDKLKLWTIARN